MKSLKMLSCAVAALALLAFFTAGSASATVLCTATETPCAAGNKLGAGTTLGWSLHATTKARLVSTGGETLNECTGSTMSGSITNAGSSTETVKASVSAANLTWSGCTSTTDTTEGGELEIHAISGTDNGTVTAKGFSITTNLFGVGCSFGFGSGADLGTFQGGSDPKVILHVIIQKVAGSFLCPTDVTWFEEWTLTVPSRPLPVYPLA